MCNKAHAVLYVDDKPDHLTMVQALLETQLNALVDPATTPAGAEQMLNSRCYDLIILDVNLTGELGTTIAERIREREPKQPILIMTEYMHPGVIEDSARAGLRLIPKGGEVPETGGLLRKLSHTDPTEFTRVVSSLLESEFCHRTRTSRPPWRICLSSPHVVAASNYLQEERKQAAGARSKN